MSCDEAFERCIQKRFDDAYPAKGKEKPTDQRIREPHRLIGVEIQIKVAHAEKTFLEGVTKIEFHEGRITFHTVLGEEIHLRAEIEKVMIRRRSFSFQVGRFLDLADRSR